MSALRTIAVTSLAFGLQIAAALAAGPPKLDVSTTCNVAAEMVGRDKKSCLEDERAAKDILAQTWSKYTAGDTTQCMTMVNAGGPPSYVELLACLESKRDAKDSRGGKSIIQADEPEQPEQPEQPTRR